MSFRSLLKLMSLITSLFTTCVCAAQGTERVETLPNKCDEYLMISIGEPISDALEIMGRQPNEKNDISIVNYTWRINDNFITLQYDRDQLVGVEVDLDCDDNEGRICELYKRYTSEWPDYDVVDYQLGKPMDIEKILREEWIWKNRTEKVYIEVRNEEVDDIECIPTRIRYIYVDEPPADKPPADKPKVPIVPEEKRGFMPAE